jgi:hypothetical protein
LKDRSGANSVYQIGKIEAEQCLFIPQIQKIEEERTLFIPQIGKIEAKGEVYLLKNLKRLKQSELGLFQK